MKKHLVIALILSLAGTGAHAEQLAYANETTTNQDGVSITVRTLTTNRNPLVSKKITQKYQPLELEIKNEGPNSYFLTKESFGLPVAKLKSVAKKYTAKPSLKYPLLGASIGSGIGVAYAFAAYSGHGEFGAIVLPLSAAVGVFYGILVGGFLMFAVFFHSQRKNAKNKKALLASNACDLGTPLHIPANTTIKKIVYVPKRKFKPEFTIALEKSPQTN